MIPAVRTIDIPATLAITLPVCSSLYWVARLLDVQGSGSIEIDLKEVAELLGKSYAAVNRYLADCLQEGFFREVKDLGGAIYRIHYAAALKIAYSRGLTLGAFFEVNAGELRALKAIAAEATVEQLQRQSFWAASKNPPSQSQARVLPLEQVLGTDEQGRQTPPTELGSMLPRPTESPVPAFRRYFVYPSIDSAYWGSTQATAAEQLGISERQLRRYLSTGYRQQYGLEPLERRQQLVPLEVSEPEFRFLQSEQLSPDAHALNYRGRLLQFRPNLYRTGVSLRSKRALRRRFRKMAA